MWAKIVSFFTAIFMFFASLFGINTGSQNDVTIFKDLSYGSDSLQSVDLYLPKDGGDNKAMYVIIHGGAWISGDKTSDEENCESIAANFGYATMSINYRMFNYPESGQTVESIISDPNSLDMYDMMDYITGSLTVAVNKAAENGFNITNACLVGFSAGAHLAMMYAYKYRAQSPVNIPFCVSYVGPIDLTDRAFCFNTPEGGIGDETAQYLASRLCHTLVNDDTFDSSATQAALQSVSPLYCADTAVPTIMAYGQKDLLVPFSGSVRLDEKLTELGIRHDYIIYPNSGHGLDNKADAANGDILYNALVTYCRDYFGY